jgi:cellobiose epimerase
MSDQNNSIGTDAAWIALPAELESEFKNILDYWEQYSVDQLEGGFFGQIDQDNNVHADAPKGSVLNARILWTFSAAYLHNGKAAYLELAARAYNYILEFLTDPEKGGLYWSVDYQGRMLDGHKQVYAQAFGIYAMSEYFRSSKDANALKKAIDWYGLLEERSRDAVHGGYTEAYARDWSFLDDKRLSSKDENANKTMNTHLHIVEAYANLYTVWPEESLKTRILDLLQIFNEHIIDKTSHHLGLFFSSDWKLESAIISYGHDIEAAWLLQSCAESVGDARAIEVAKKNATGITRAAMEGLDRDGGLWYEFDPAKNELVYEKHWWPQAEALVGFYNAWKLTGSPEYKTALLRNWNFIKNQILDNKNGEWFWGIDRNNHKMPGQDKIGFWKCPYHNSRACLELLKRF